MHTTILAQFLAITLAAQAAGAQTPSPAATAQDALQRALERAQKDVESKLELWADHSTWEKAWQVASPHYIVRTTRSHWFGRQMGETLESMYPRFQELLAPGFEPPSKLVVNVFPDIASYNTFGEQNGAEHSSFYGSFFAQQASDRSVAATYHENPTLMRMWLTHSATHQFLDRAFTSPRLAWIEEGLSAYFELQWDYAYGVAELERMKAEGKLIPLRQLLPAPVQQYTTRTHERFIQLGMLMYYLLYFREDTRTVMDEGVLLQAPFNDYLREMLTGRDNTKNPVHELFTQRIDELERDFHAYEF
jgi:hypothetical protein